MNKLKAILIAATVVLCTVASASSFAHGGGRYHGHTRVGVGVVIGAPFAYAPWYYGSYYSPYYYPGPAYYPAPVAYPYSYSSGPTTYVEQGQEPAAAAPRQDNYWYYCPGAKAYYPYVSQCAGGWQKVSPTPQS